MDNQVILSADGQQSEKSVIIYRSEDGTIQLEVQLHEETVWLTRPQMALLFNTTPQNVTMHIGNIYTEEELDENSTSKDFLLVQKEGNRSIKSISLLKLRYLLSKASSTMAKYLMPTISSPIWSEKPKKK